MSIAVKKFIFNFLINTLTLCLDGEFQNFMNYKHTHEYKTKERVRVIQIDINKQLSRIRKLT